MEFALLMLIGTVITRVVHHLKKGNTSINLYDEAFDFIITFIVYTVMFLLITFILTIWS